MLWEIAIRLFNVPTFVLPAPTAIIQSLIDSRMQLARCDAVHRRRKFCSVSCFAAITGIVVALVIVRFERFGRALYPLIVLVPERAEGGAGADLHSLVRL